MFLSVSFLRGKVSQYAVFLSEQSRLVLENLLTSFQILYFKVPLMMLNEECSACECGFSFVSWHLLEKNWLLQKQLKIRSCSRLGQSICIFKKRSKAFYLIFLYDFCSSLMTIRRVEVSVNCEWTQTSEDQSLHNNNAERVAWGLTAFLDVLDVPNVPANWGLETEIKNITIRLFYYVTLFKLP